MSVRAPYNQNEESGSIRLGLAPQLFDLFPSEVTWNGLSLSKKEEFHVTLLHAKLAPELTRVSNEKIASFFDSSVEKSPIALVSFLNDFRYAEEDSKRTVVVRCVVSNLDKLFTRFNRAFGVQLPVQPAHVTLYSLQKNVGIHINSGEHMERLGRVRLPELEEALKKVSLI